MGENERGLFPAESVMKNGDLTEVEGSKTMSVRICG